MKTIDTGLSAAELFDAVIEAGNHPPYDPAKHLIAKVAADRWHMGEKAALLKLRRLAPEMGLVETIVRLETGYKVAAFTKG